MNRDGYVADGIGDIHAVRGSTRGTGQICQQTQQPVHRATSGNSESHVDKADEQKLVVAGCPLSLVPALIGNLHSPCVWSQDGPSFAHARAPAPA